MTKALKLVFGRKINFSAYQLAAIEMVVVNLSKKRYARIHPNCIQSFNSPCTTHGTIQHTT